MHIVRELCGACPQDIVVELDDGSRFNFYFRHGGARLYDEWGATLLTSRRYVSKLDPMADGILLWEELEPLVEDMVREWRSQTYPHTDYIKRLCYGCGTLIAELQDVWIDVDSNCCVCPDCKVDALRDYPETQYMNAMSMDAPSLNELQEG